MVILIRRSGCICIIVLLLGMCFFVVQKMSSNEESDQERMLRFFCENESEIFELMKEVEGDCYYFVRGYPLGALKILKWAYRNGIRSIDGRGKDGWVSFKFVWAKSPMEGATELIYNPQDMPPICEEWHVEALVEVEISENRWHWKGNGVCAAGYIIIERLQENLFYYTGYWPT